jgi:predicted metalloprotease with PDZ domain
VFRLPPCPPDGCRVRYRFALAEAARRVGELHCALEANGAFVTSPSAWLMHPAECHGAEPFELHVTAPPGVTFVTGLLPAASGALGLPPAAYAADLSDLPNPAWAAVGEMRLFRVDVEGEALDVAVLPGALDLGDDGLRAWITDAARAVRDHYGLTPIRRVQLVIIPGSGRGIGYARALGNGGATVVVPLGQHTPAAELTGGWELIHELLHVAFPKLTRDHSWLEEGMATYVEPLLRARRGNLPVDEMFARLRQRMPFGLPAHGDGGLDGTHSWGRTYWGGAIFCLLADVAIRERTRGQRSLDDALRAILAQGGNIAERWDVEQVVAVGDEATGVPVLRELYAKMGGAAVDVDLDGLWQRLGVVAKGPGVTFDEGAELAWVRRGMVERGGRGQP